MHSSQSLRSMENHAYAVPGLGGVGRRLTEGILFMSSDLAENEIKGSVLDLWD